MTDPLTIECTIHVRRHGKGAAKNILPGAAPERPVMADSRLPRVVRLMALAHRFEQLLQSGQVADYADLARLGRVSRARVSQIMQLLLLAPVIQEEVLFLPPITRGRAPLLLADLLPIAGIPDWSRQRRMWQTLRKGVSVPGAE